MKGMYGNLNNNKVVINYALSGLGCPDFAISSRFTGCWQIAPCQG